MDLGEPYLGCVKCGEHAISIPEWVGDETLIACDSCGEPIGSIGEIQKLLRAALEEEVGDFASKTLVARRHDAAGRKDHASRSSHDQVMERKSSESLAGHRQCGSAGPSEI